MIEADPLLTVKLSAFLLDPIRTAVWVLQAPRFVLWKEWDSLCPSSGDGGTRGPHPSGDRVAAQEMPLMKSGGSPRLAMAN